jgi:hypothetical protein
MDAIARYLTSSTLKREFAVVLVAWWAGIGTYLMVRLPVTQQIADASLVAWGALTIPILTVATGAFAADWVSKQTNIAGPPANTQTTVTAAVTDDAATVTTKTEPTQ